MSKLLPAFLCSLALAAQAPPGLWQNPELAKEPQTLAQLARRWTSRQPRWVLLEGTRGEWLASFGVWQRSDETLVAAGIYLSTFPATSALALRMRTEQGWGPEARWLLVDPKGALLAHGLDPGGPGHLAEVLEAQGVRGELSELERFVARHPDHVQAQQSLVERSLLNAQRLDSAACTRSLGPVAPGRRKALAAAWTLPPKEDERIWGLAAARLERFLQSGAWRLAQDVASSSNHQDGCHSPLMREVSRRCLPLLEDALRRYPSHRSAWTLWLLLANHLGGRPLRPLVDSLQAMPGRLEAVPHEVYVHYQDEARAREDWAGLIELLGPRWDAARETHMVTISGWSEGPEAFDPLMGPWNDYLGTLVEAHLRLGHLGEADRIVQDVMAWMPSAGLPSWAATLAGTCGQPVLAGPWSRLAVPAS